MKRFTALILSIILVLLQAFTTAVSAHAEGEGIERLTEGSYEFTVRGDGTAEITDYTGRAVYLKVPDTLQGHEVTAIGRGAFSDVSNLMTVVLPDTLLEIHDNPFMGCLSLRDIRVSEKNSSFSVTDGILYSKKDKQLICCPAALPKTEVEVEKKTKAIGAYAFYGCGNVESVVLPDSVKSIGASAFKQCEALSGVTFGDGLTEISDKAFEGCISLEFAEFPEGLESIGKDAFRDCVSLVRISLPGSLRTLTENPFANCAGLAEITVAEENPVYASVDQVLFDKTEQMLVCYPGGSERQEYIIPEGTESIGAYAFFRCGGLVAVGFPEGLKRIGTAAFSGCGALNVLDFAWSLEEISEYAFEFCSGLTEAHFNEGLKKIGNDAFSMCGSLRSAKLPEGLSSLGEDAFSFCSHLKSVSIPKSLTRVTGNPFMYCSRLREIHVTPGNTVFREKNGALVNTRDKILVTYPAGLGRVFYQVPEGVKIIGEYAFYNCSTVQTVYLPDSVTEIRNGAFSFCSGLRDFVLPGELTEFGTGAFVNCGNCEFIVPAGSPAAEHLKEQGFRIRYEKKTVPEGIRIIA